MAVCLCTSPPWYFCCDASADWPRGKRLNISRTYRINSSWSTSKIVLHVNLFHTTGLFLYPLKTSENQRFSDVFMVYRKRPMAYGLSGPSYTYLRDYQWSPGQITWTLTIIAYVKLSHRLWIEILYASGQMTNNLQKLNSRFFK